MFQNCVLVVGGSLLRVSYISCLNCCRFVRSRVAVRVVVCVLVGLILSASLVVVSSSSLAAVRWLVGDLLLYSSCIHWWRVVSCSCSCLLMSSWACWSLRMFQRVVRLMSRVSAICWFVHWGCCVMRSMAWIRRALFFSSVGVSSCVCWSVCIR